MLNIRPIYGGYSICHDITHNSYNEQAWEFTYVLLWVPGILVIVMTKAAMFVPLDPTPPWPNQLDQCWTGPIESGTRNSWVSYVCRDEAWWVEAMCKVRYMQQPPGGRRKPVCREGQKPGPQIQREGCLRPFLVALYFAVPFISENFPRLQTGRPSTKPGLQINFIRLTHLKF